MPFHWSAPRPVGRAPNLYNVTDVTWVESSLLATNNMGGVARLADGHWVGLVSDAAAAPALGARVGLQVRFAGWGGRLCGLASSGAVLSLDPAGPSWQPLCGPDPTPKVVWPLAAFDSARNVLVVWGPQKSNGHRQDATWVFDGQRWAKPKKGAAVPAADLAQEAGAFSLSFDARLGGVVRTGTTSAALFDGKVWQPLSLVAPDALHTWERVALAMPATRQSFLVQRFASDPSIVELVGSGPTLTVNKVASLPLAVDRQPNSPGSNVAYDVAGFDQARCVLVALDERQNTVSELDLSSLVRTESSR